MNGRTQRRNPTISQQRTSLPRDGHSHTPGVVVGVDGARSSWSAFWWACGEAQRLDGRLIAVYVSPPPSRSISAGTTLAASNTAGHVIALSHEDHANELKTEIEARATGLGIEISFWHCHGDAAEQLKTVARETQADMIAVGRSTRRRHPLARSLGRRLMRGYDAPIVVIVP
jgi:nucleotide-binding universal stress UspA family protein